MLTMQSWQRAACLKGAMVGNAGNFVKGWMLAGVPGANTALRFVACVIAPSLLDQFTGCAKQVTTVIVPNLWHAHDFLC